MIQSLEQAKLVAFAADDKKSQIKRLVRKYEEADRGTLIEDLQQILTDFSGSQLTHFEMYYELLRLRKPEKSEK